MIELALLVFEVSFDCDNTGEKSHNSVEMMLLEMQTLIFL